MTHWRLNQSHFCRTCMTQWPLCWPEWLLFSESLWMMTQLPELSLSRWWRTKWHPWKMSMEVERYDPRTHWTSEMLGKTWNDMGQMARLFKDVQSRFHHISSYYQNFIIFYISSHFFAWKFPWDCVPNATTFAPRAWRLLWRQGLAWAVPIDNIHLGHGMISPTHLWHIYGKSVVFLDLVFLGQFYRKLATFHGIFPWNVAKSWQFPAWNSQQSMDLARVARRARPSITSPRLPPSYAATACWTSLFRRIPRWKHVPMGLWMEVFHGFSHEFQWKMVKTRSFDWQRG